MARTQGRILEDFGRVSILEASAFACAQGGCHATLQKLHFLSYFLQTPAYMWYAVKE